MSTEKNTKSVYLFRGKIIREVRRKKGWTQKDLARALGVAQARISEWERGIGSPTVENYIILSGEYGFDLAWLLSGQEAKRFDVEKIPQPVIKFAEAGVEPQDLETANYLSVPLLADPIAAGEPMINLDEIAEWAWIHISQIGKRKNLVAIRIAGNSMHPLILDGAIVAIDRDDHKPPGLFAVRCPDEGVTVKHVKVLDHALLLVPENRDFEERLITLAKGESLHDVIIGRAVWQWSDLSNL